MLVHLALGRALEGDVYWHLAAGQWMLGHHAVIRHDVFSYTVPGHPWLAEEWGFEVMLAWLVAHVGPVAFWWVAAVPCVAAMVLGFARWVRLGASPLWVAVLTVPAAGALALGVDARPQVLSYMFFSAELLILALARRRTAWLGAIPALMLVWVNVHGSFLLGIALLAMECVLAFAFRATGSAGPPRSFGRVCVSGVLPLRATAGALAATVAASFVNPHGPSLLAYALKVTASGRLSSMIEEWQSPNFHSIPLLVIILGPALLLLGALALTKVRLELFDLLLWLGILAASLHAIRFVPYLGIAFAGLAAPWPPFARGSLRPKLATIPLAAVLAGSLLVGSHPAAGAPQTHGSDAIPLRAAAWVSHQRGHVFSTYLWNSYLIHLGVPVFVDGRTDMYFGTGVLTTYTKVESLTVDPDTVFGRWSVRFVLWPSSSALSEYLLHDPRWTVVMRDGPGVLFERRT